MHTHVPPLSFFPSLSFSLSAYLKEIVWSEKERISIEKERVERNRGKISVDNNNKIIYSALHSVLSLTSILICSIPFYPVLFRSCQPRGLLEENKSEGKIQFPVKEKILMKN